MVLSLGVGVALALAGIQPAQAAPAAAQITLNPTQGPAGSAVTVSGAGFKASATGTVTAGSTTFSFRTTAAGGSKADWNTDRVSYLAAQPDVMGFVWFHFQKEADWGINSSASSASAFSTALLARRS